MLAFSRQNYTYGNFYIFKYHLDMHVHLVSWDLLLRAGSVTAPRSPASWWPLECGQDLRLDSEQQNAAKVMGFLWLHVPGSAVMLRKIAALSCGGLSLLGFEEVGSHVGEAHAAGNSRRSLGAVEQSLTYKKENYIRKLGPWACSHQEMNPINNWREVKSKSFSSGASDETTAPNNI